MHLTIAICDDNPGDISILKNFIEDYKTMRQVCMDIDTFSSGEEFLSGLKQKNYDIIFMDIYMTGMSGIETVRTIRNSSPASSSVIFTSTSREHAIEAFGVNAAHYLLKPLTYDAVEEALERCILKFDGHLSKQITLKCSQGDITIPLDNILYIEVFNKVCTIHTAKRSFQTYMTLNSIFELLDDSFMKAQRSFIVNMHTIKSFYFDHIVLTDGKDIVLSRKNRSDLKKQYQDFLFHAARRGMI